MNYRLYLLVIDIILVVNMSFGQQEIINRSRNNTVQIISRSGNSSGSGFFLNDQQIATCFHVVAKIEVQGQNVQWTIYQDLQVVLMNGDTITARCITPPTKKDILPLVHDFAVLQLESKPSIQINPNPLAQNDTTVTVGADVYFSGYPLATPAMVTHEGMISGRSADGKIICLQASINKGNSGGALLNSRSEVIGIISMREGGISSALLELGHFIEATEKQGSVQLMGVDPLQATKEIIRVLDTYISTGIGYAITIKYLREYIDAHSK